MQKYLYTLLDSSDWINGQFLEALQGTGGDEGGDEGDKGGDEGDKGGSQRSQRREGRNEESPQKNRWPGNEYSGNQPRKTERGCWNDKKSIVCLRAQKRARNRRKFSCCEGRLGKSN